VRDLLYYKGTPVPYITSWSQEIHAATHGAGNGGTRVRLEKVDLPSFPLTVRYPDESPADRDPYGCLWQRYPIALGKGTPRFASVHPARQRRCMTRFLCQVCGNPADRDEDGWLWLLTAPDAERIAAGGEAKARVGNPPVCRSCCDIARDRCPHLLNGHAVVRARGMLPWGVYGILMDPSGQTPGQFVPYGSPDIRRTLAGQMLGVLQDVRITNLSAT
jgi:hypothetical protein